MEIRSYRSVFDLERRIYSVDRLRLNPGGVPLRGILYFLALLLVALLLGSLPGLRLLARPIPWYLRDLAVPACGAVVLGAVRLEGRTFHHAAAALLLYRSRPRRLAGLDRHATVRSAWHPHDIVFLPDGSDAGFRRLLYTGPGAVLVAAPHARGGRAFEHGGRGWARPGWGSELWIRPRAGGGGERPGEVISLAAGARLRVCPDAPRRG